MLKKPWAAGHHPKKYSTESFTIPTPSLQQHAATEAAEGLSGFSPGRWIGLAPEAKTKLGSPGSRLLPSIVVPT